MNQVVSKTIEINLDLDQPQKILKKNLIQQKVFDSLKKRVIQRLDWLKREHTSVIENPPKDKGWVSFIDGTRGAGKSTFLQTVLELFSEGGDKINGLSIIRLIDPSRIESSEIILLTVLQELKRKVEKFLVCESSEESQKKKKNWERNFKDVAEGLSLFQHNHHPLAELDADLFLDIGLAQAGHSSELRNKLHILFHSSCEILGVKALLLAFDDADTSASHAMQVLETVRKYLDTPHIMILVTGDMELYSLLVRDHFSQELIKGI